MNRLVLVLVVVTLASIAACGDEEARAPERGVTASSSEQPERGRRREREPLFGPDGRLLESDVVVAGLKLPRGLEETLEEERRHVYRTSVRLEAVQQYFGTRLLTGQVDRVGSGAIYRNAEPQGVRGGVVRMDVSILPLSDGKTRVEIVELPPPPAKTPPEAHVRQQLREHLQRLD